MSRLRQQQQLVERKVREVERARVALLDARAALVGQFRRRLGSPQTLLLAFGAGFAMGARRFQPRRRQSPAKFNLPRRLFAASGSWLLRLWAASRSSRTPTELQL